MVFRHGISALPRGVVTFQACNRRLNTPGSRSKQGCAYFAPAWSTAAVDLQPLHTSEHMLKLWCCTSPLYMFVVDQIGAYLPRMRTSVRIPPAFRAPAAHQLVGTD